MVLSSDEERSAQEDKRTKVGAESDRLPNPGTARAMNNYRVQKSWHGLDEFVYPNDYA